MKEFMKMAIRSIEHSRLRSWLTLIGIAIGISSVVALISVGDGLQVAVQKEFDQIGTDRIAITPAGSSFGPLSGDLSAAILTTEDLETIRDVQGVESSAGLKFTTVQAEHRDDSRQVSVFVHDTDRETLDTIRASNLFDLSSGSYFGSGDELSINIGWEVANSKFEREVRRGDEFLIGEVEFEVTGIHEKIGSPVHDNSIRMSSDDAERIGLAVGDDFTMIVAITNTPDITASVAEDIERSLRRSRGVDEGEEDFVVNTPQDLLDAVFGIFNIIQSVVIGIAAVSIVVGGVGIMNTMYTAVVQRTNEVGIMKAMGAKTSSIVTIFSLEAGMLGAIGGAFGILLGIGIGKAVELAAVRTLGTDLIRPVFTPELIVGSLIFSFLVGAASGLLPAMKASKLSPVEALSYE